MNFDFFVLNHQFERRQKRIFVRSNRQLIRATNSGQRTKRSTFSLGSCFQSETDALISVGKWTTASFMVNCLMNRLGSLCVCVYSTGIDLTTREEVTCVRKGKLTDGRRSVSGGSMHHAEPD